MANHTRGDQSLQNRSLRYEGPKGGPRMREMLAITGTIKAGGVGLAGRRLRLTGPALTGPALTVPLNLTVPFAGAD